MASSSKTWAAVGSVREQDHRNRCREKEGAAYIDRSECVEYAGIYCHNRRKYPEHFVKKAAHTTSDVSNWC